VTWTEDRSTGISPRWDLAMMTAVAEGSSSFSGYQLLLEYFTFREKFMFTGLRGLETWSFRLSSLV
jgi:type VI protein secretion system component VasA